MADEAFALSPIGARPSLPSEADYDAIREAFMETSRGRWFLSEYAKRNRNADTSMVLDAVARIEQNIAAQKQASGNGLTDSLDAIRALIKEARASVAQSIAGLGDGEALAGALEGARVIREVAWTLRECGADTRICDLMDAQLAVVDSGHRKITAIDPQAIFAAFDQLMLRIGDLASGDVPAPSAAEPVAGSEQTSSPPAAMDESQNAPAEPPQAQSSQVAASAPEPAVSAQAHDLTPDQPSSPVTETAQPAAAELRLEPEPAAEEAAPPIEAANSDQDHAVFVDLDSAEGAALLDLVALEMSAPDFDEEASAGLPEMDLEFAEPANNEPAGLEASVAVTEPEAASDPEPVTAHEPAPAPEPAFASAPANFFKPAPAPPPSLGAALLASGVVARPATSGIDPLAPIRRMSQAEKIAFFS